MEGVERKEGLIFSNKKETVYEWAVNKWILKERMECKFLASSVSADDVSMLRLSHGGPGSSDKLPSAASAPGSGATSE